VSYNRLANIGGYKFPTEQPDMAKFAGIVQNEFDNVYRNGSPVGHQHAIADVSGLQVALDAIKKFVKMP
jgi:hypothetical protein